MFRGLTGIWIVCRKALQLLTYVTQQQPAAVPVQDLTSALLKLVEADDSDLREAALALLVPLSQQPATDAQLRKVSAFPVLAVTNRSADGTREIDREIASREAYSSG